MFVEELYEDLQKAEKYLPTMLRDGFEAWYNEEHPVGGSLDDIKGYNERLLRMVQFSKALIEKAQHFHWSDEEPPAPLLPLSSETLIEEVPELLSRLEANLPYPAITISYRSPDEDKGLCTVAILYELIPGLLSISVWQKRGKGELTWHPISSSVLLSTRGDFSYWMGARDYFQELGNERLLEIMSDARGYIVPYISLYDFDSDGDFVEAHEQDLDLLSIDLMAYIIPYLYLLNVKNVPIKEHKSIRGLIHKVPRSLGTVIYKTLELDFPIRRGGGASGKGGSEEERRLHLCRGHMKEYRKEGPLFGKYVGVIWCPPHFRGNKAMGEVKKTYRSKGRKQG